MKKKVLSLAFAASGFLLFNNNVKAQEGLCIGVEGTPHVSWLLNQDDMDNNQFTYISTITGSFGISGHYGFNKNVGIGLNALYSFQGQRYKLSGTERMKSVEYLKIPLMFVYGYEINSNLLFTGKIGPQLDLLMNACLTDKDGNKIVSDQKDAYEDYEISGMVSAGIGYKINDNFIVDAAVRYDYGLTDAEDKDYKYHVNQPNIPTNGSGNAERATTNNETLGLTVGIRYLFTKK